mmetsp:Transcript_43066/g.73465  ORF Transcript_43066/g.73465 Transcript_43066/m.73465 type:complete len:204 (-) Transcript_43066:703-1314(-)
MASNLLRRMGLRLLSIHHRLQLAIVHFPIGMLPTGLSRTGERLLHRAAALSAHDESHRLGWVGRVLPRLQSTVARRDMHQHPSNAERQADLFDHASLLQGSVRRTNVRTVYWPTSQSAHVHSHHVRLRGGILLSAVRSAVVGCVLFQCASVAVQQGRSSGLFDHVDLLQGSVRRPSFGCLSCQPTESAYNKSHRYRVVRFLVS